MAQENYDQPGLTTLVSRLARTGLGALQNRLELLAVEWQQERTRLSELMAWLVVLLFLAIMGTLLLTATIILLFRAELRVYVAGAFTALYFLGALGAWAGVRSLLKREPFEETISQAKKDRLCLESLK